MRSYDKIIIGAGLYGLYSALYCAKNDQKVIVLEADDALRTDAILIVVVIPDLIDGRVDSLVRIAVRNRLGSA